LNKQKVYIVGAGPGDPELITIKAIKILKEADVVLYDRLVNKEILRFAPKSAELINVGKEYGKQNEIQNKIFDYFLYYQKENKKIIRLKGGDPFIFGRGAEELEFLIKNKIEFEIIPGISSVLSIPIHFNIPLTHRMYSSSIAIVTGHESQSKISRKVDFALISRSVDTIIILMGLNNLPIIIKSLLEGGLSNTTPIAIIEHGFFSDQKKVVATLKTIITEVQKKEIKPPALIIVGKVINVFKK